MQTACYRVRIKPGMSERARAWSAQSLCRDARDGDGPSLELAFLENAPDGDYLVYVLRAPDLLHAVETFEASAHPDARARLAFVDEVWGEGRRLETLLAWP